MFYLINQNNSGGFFDVTDTLCHRLIIEADSEREALYKAEELGCYWNGVERGLDCSCCGDRWSGYVHSIDLTEGHTVSVYGYTLDDAKEEWENKYGKYRVIEELHFEKNSFMSNYKRYIGKIAFGTIEEYAQYLADKYGWTRPDGRIFYKDGTVKEIFTGGVEYETLD